MGVGRHSDHSFLPSQAVHCKEKAFVYNECITCCPASCQSRASCVDSEIACVDGCYCPNGSLGRGSGGGAVGARQCLPGMAWIGGNQGLGESLFVE